MAGLRQHVVWLLQYAALRVVQVLVQTVPLESGLRAAQAAGTLLYWLDKRHRAVALENLRASFPGAGQAAIERTARRSFQYMIMQGVEFLYIPRTVRFGAFHRYVVPGPRMDEGMALLSARRPCIVVGGHFGNWEITMGMLAAAGYSPVSVGRPLDNPYLDRFVRRLREYPGQRIITKFGMTDEALGLLRSGALLGFPADQDAGRRGFFVDFFGRKASAYKSIAYLALHEGAYIIVGGAYRLKGPRIRYVPTVTDIIDPSEYDRDAAGAWAITQRYTAGLERVIRMAPEQYLWVHRRWKTRPPATRNAERGTRNA
jgi:KDO2-lipid IV(A) lauroyltransferase